MGESSGPRRASRRSRPPERLSPDTAPRAKRRRGSPSRDPPAAADGVVVRPSRRAGRNSGRRPSSAAEVAVQAVAAPPPRESRSAGTASPPDGTLRPVSRATAALPAVRRERQLGYSDPSTVSPEGLPAALPEVRWERQPGHTSAPDYLSHDGLPAALPRGSGGWQHNHCPSSSQGRPDRSPSLSPVMCQFPQNGGRGSPHPPGHPRRLRSLTGGIPCFPDTDSSCWLHQGALQFQHSGCGVQGPEYGLYGWLRLQVVISSADFNTGKDGVGRCIRHGRWGVVPE